VTTNVQEAISQAYQAGIEIGRAAARQEMEQITRILAGYAEHAASVPFVPPSGNGATKRTRAVKPAASKATIVARGVKRAGATRTSGVKKGILDVIGTTAMSTSDIISATGFNANSVRATLMALKKTGLAENNDKLWIATVSPAGALRGSNSESESAEF
jgi:hypothetical protein